MNKVIEDLRNEIRWTRQSMREQKIALEEVKTKIAAGETDVIAPSYYLSSIRYLQGKIRAFERAIDLVELAKLGA
jgi:predicted  nucleic acid-binding Zn-ribbon protein